MIALKAIAEMQASADSNKTCNAFRTLARGHQCLNRTHPFFQLIDVFVPNKTKMCDASQLAVNEHKGHIKSKMMFTFQLIVEFKQVHQRKLQQFLDDNSSSKVISKHGPNQHKLS